MKIARSLPAGLGDQEVKGQGHGRPTLDLGAWRRHQSRSVESSRGTSDGNAALEKGVALVLRRYTEIPNRYAIF